MKNSILFIIAILLNSAVFAQLTAEQQKIYNNLSPAERKKVDDKIKVAANDANNNMVLQAVKIRNEQVLQIKPLSNDSVMAIIGKVNKAGEFTSYFDLLVYKNFGGNDNYLLKKYEAADSSYLYAKNALTKKDLSTASANIVFYYYKNIYDYASSLFKRAKYQQALDNYIEATEYYKPDSANYFAAKSGIELLKQGVAVNRQSVLENLNKAVLLDAKSDLFVRERGYFYLSQLKDTSFGIADLTKAVQLNTKDHISYQLLSLIEFNKSNLKEALRYINKSIEIDKNNDTYYFQRGLFYSYQQEHALAIADFNLAILKNKFDPKFYIYRAKSNMSLKNYPDAYDDFGFASMLNPNDAASKEQLQKLDPLLKPAYEKEGFTMSNAFKFFMDRGDKQAKDAQGYQQGRAVMNYYKCIQLEPKNPIPYNKAGNIFMVFKMNGPAEQFLRYAAYADGKKASYFEDLGTYYVSNKDYKSALGCYDTAALIGSTNADTYSMIGSIRFSFKEYEASVKAFSKAISLNPSLVEVRYMRALVYMDNLKNYQAALTDLELLVKAEPNNQDYLQALKLCKEKLKK
jgi:tetratricopeptide (TPR) repeat protein